MEDEYSHYVAHPRFGQRPRLTGLNPQTDMQTGSVFLHWHSPKECRIPHTAIRADLSKQSRATVPVTHYYDVRRECSDCGRPFLFFAEEQQYWYEDMGFALESNCVRCVPCRKRKQGIEQKRARYEELLHKPDPSIDERLEMAECCLTLMEAGEFYRRQTERVRMILRQVKSTSTEDQKKVIGSLINRVKLLEVAQ